ncbi:hypothetical protein [Campylobacter canadensis]|nr:hypothetical protein [Campylobacter canadensis]
MNYLIFLELLKNDEILKKLINHQNKAKKQKINFKKYNYINF